MKKIKLLFLALAVIICNASMTLAETPSAWLSAPSTAVSGQKIDITGGNLTASSALTIKIISPDSSVTTVYATSDENGNLSASCAPNSSGLFKVELFNAEGDRIASTTFASTAP